MLIPVVGPFIATTAIDSYTGRFAMVFGPGLGQVAGLSLGIAGAVLFSRSNQRRTAAINPDGIRLTRRAPTLRLANLATPAGSGLQLRYRF